jgi:AcrR family transcriptional regulator
MAPRKRTQSTRKLLGAQNSETRAALVETVAQIMREEGYAAVTARKVADRLGMKHQVVFYYFDTIDDLLLEAFRSGGESGRTRLAAAAKSDQPLRALWEIMRDTQGNRWLNEFTALANHNEAIRAEIAHYAKESRELQADAIARHLHARGVEPRISPLFLTVLLTAIGRLLVREENLDIDVGHAEVEATVEAWLRQFEATGEAARAVFEAS